MVEATNLVDILQWRALHQSDRTAYTFLLDGEYEEIRLSYAELDYQARTIGATLQQLCSVGDRALLLYPPGIEYIAAFFGCLYAGVIAVPAYPPRSSRVTTTMARLRAIAGNARPTIILSTSSVLAEFQPLFAHDPDFHAITWATTDTCAGAGAEFWQPPQLSSATLAFLQYTSGSTATPKAVMVSHGNLMANEHMIAQAFAHTEQSVIVGWLPLYHDMGLIGNLLQPLYVGAPCILMSPVSFIQRPLRWLQAISHYGATTSGGPNFAYDLCVRKIAPEERAALNLQSWQVAFNGAEPVRHATLSQFAAAFAPCGFRSEAFYPCYGLAEATLFVTGGQVGTAPTVRVVDKAALEEHRLCPAAPGASSLELVGCGRSWSQQRLTIVDPETLQRCPPQHVGEVWVAGEHIAGGYWDQPEATRQTFGADLEGAGPFLRTGDLGVVVDDELFVTGRLKDLIIIRGRNYYPQDIELTAERSHAALRPNAGAAFSVDQDGEERLVLVCEVDRHCRDAGEVIAAIRQAIFQEHLLQVFAVVLIKTGTIFKTSSGKIQRRACRAAFLAGTLEAVATDQVRIGQWRWADADLSRDALLATPLDARAAFLEQSLQQALAHLLKVHPEQLSSQRRLSTVGLDSLNALEVQHLLERSLGVAPPLLDLLQGPSIAELAVWILEQVARASTAGRAPQTAPQPAGWDDMSAYPLSYGQQALWLFQQMMPDQSVYNIARAVRIPLALDVAALQQAVQTLVDRHPALRTMFIQQSGEVAQQVLPRLDVSIGVEDAATWSPTTLDQRLNAAAREPFNLEQAPLFRMVLFRRAAQEYILLLSIHHIVTDLWSLAVLLHELGALYAAQRERQPAALGAVAGSYHQYVRWQAEMLSGAEGTRLRSFWQAKLADYPPALELPTDRLRPPTRTYQSAYETFTLPAALTAEVKSLCRAHNTTLYVALLAVFKVLLYRYTGQTDLVVGSPTFGRSRAEWAGTLGYFVSPLLIRTALDGRLSFRDILDRLKANVLEALAHQDYPFPLLLEYVQHARDGSRMPLIDVLFTFQKAPLLDAWGLTAFAMDRPGTRMQIGPLVLESLPLLQHLTQFDLDLTLAEVDGSLAGVLKYNSDLFQAATVGRMIGHFVTLLAAATADPDRPIARLALLTDAEQELVLRTWNLPEADYQRPISVTDLFVSVVREAPTRICTEYHGTSLTFQEINDQAEQLACFIKEIQG